MAEPLEFEMIGASNRVRQIVSTSNWHSLMEVITLFGISSPTTGVTYHKSNLANTDQSHWKRKKDHTAT